MKFGFHISIRGGFRNVVGRAKKTNCETIQLFSRNPRGWKHHKLDPQDVEIFRSEIAESEIDPVFIHLPYLPNLGTGKKDLFRRSVALIKEELKRAAVLGIDYIITHVGSRVGIDEKTAIENVVLGTNSSLEAVDNGVMILFENTAGGGNKIGWRFEQLAEIIGSVVDKTRVGFVIDTAHLYEAGYDIRNHLDDVIEEFDRVVGLNHLKLLHLNDSKTSLGSRVDRHWHIGKGEIGLEGFRRIVNHKGLKDLPGIMETPRTSVKEDLMNMRTIRSLVEKN